MRLINEAMTGVELRVSEIYAKKYLHGNINKADDIISNFFSSSTNKQKKVYWNLISRKNYDKAAKFIHDSKIKNEIRIVVREVMEDWLVDDLKHDLGWMLPGTGDWSSKWKSWIKTFKRYGKKPEFVIILKDGTKIDAKNRGYRSMWVYMVDQQVFANRNKYKLKDYLEDKILQLNDLEKLERELKRVDWTYAMSDDHRYWLSGEKHRQKILKMIKDLSKKNNKNSIVKLWNKYRPKNLDGTWWVPLNKLNFKGVR